jgi:uncharacterized phage protein (TIGR02220 family)/predicted phage replisome organizer
LAEVKWIKLTTDMFDNRKIKHLRRLPEGNNIVLIWVMLLTMAGRCNSGGMIFLTENIPYTPKMLADELDFEENTVQLALNALEQLDMVVTNKGHFTIAGWEEYQNIEGMDKIRESKRLAQARWRAKQKELPDVDSTVDSTRYLVDDAEEDKDKDIDKEKEYISIVSYLNEKAGTGFKATTAKTKSAIHARLAEGFTLEDFKIVIDKKCQEWIGTDMQKYLRPETLFGTKFEGYLNAKTGRNETNAGVKQDIRQVRKYGNYI